MFYISLIGIIGMTIATIALLVLFARCDDLSRAVLSDVLFFCAVGLFLVFALSNKTAITYEVAVFASVLSVLSTVANSRMLAGGQR